MNLFTALVHRAAEDGRFEVVQHSDGSIALYVRVLGVRVMLSSFSTAELRPRSA